MRLLTLIAALVLLGSCNRGPVLEIEGTLPEAYNGRYVYLVPLPDRESSRVDSARVHDGRFRLRVAADTLRMAELISSIRVRLRTQRLLVAIEPGTLHVVLDTVSRYSGTPRNDALNLWKERTIALAHESIRLSRHMATQKERADSLKACREQLFDSIRRLSVDLMRRYPDAMGAYLYTLCERQLDSAQKAEMRELGIAPPINRIRIGIEPKKKS